MLSFTYSEIRQRPKTFLTVYIGRTVNRVYRANLAIAHMGTVYYLYQLSHRDCKCLQKIVQQMSSSSSILYFNNSDAGPTMTEMLPYVGKFLKHLPNYNIQPLILVHTLIVWKKIKYDQCCKTPKAKILMNNDDICHFLLPLICSLS